MLGTGLSPSFFSTFPSIEMRARVLDALERRFTGLVKVAFPPDRDVVMLISDGIVRQVYVQGSYRFECHAGNTWSLHLTSQTSGRFWMQDTPEQMLLFQRILVEQRDNGERKGVATADLTNYFSSFMKKDRATLLQVKWKTADAYLLTPGSGMPLQRAVFIGGGVSADQVALAQIKTMNEPNCTVIAYDCSINSDASLGIHLNILFEWFANSWLSYYRVVSGSLMAQAVIDEMARVATRRGYSFSSSDNSVKDATIFLSVAQAAEGYHDLLDIIADEMQLVLGKALGSKVRMASIANLSNYYRDLVRIYHLVH